MSTQSLMVAAGATAVSTSDIRAQVEAELVAGTNITITPAGSGATRTLTIDAVSGGSSDHGTLTGLGDDDHTQYHNDARGDARYTAIAHEGAGGTAHADVIAAGASGFMSGSDKTKLNGIATGATANSAERKLLQRLVTFLLLWPLRLLSRQTLQR